MKPRGAGVTPPSCALGEHMHRATSAYIQTSVSTTSQGEVLLILYDGAIKFLGQAKERIEAKDPAGKGILISKALDILNELDSTLNPERGGKIAENLHNLYTFCNNHLLKANIRMSTEMVDEVINILSGLRSAYASIIDLPEAQAAGMEAAANQHTKANTIQRSGIGTASSGTAPLPATASATAKGLNLYAKKFADIHPQQGTPPNAATSLLSTAQQIANAVSAQPAAPAAPSVAAATPAQQPPTAMPKTPEPVHAELPPPLQDAPAFSSRQLAGANLYRKFASGS